MNSQIYSRDYLQGIPEQRKQAIIDQFTASFRGELFNAAALGKTSYMYNRSTKHNSGITTYPPPPEITDAELIAGFTTRFPGCKIYYEEVWTDVSSTKRILKKGIIIDWS